MRTLFDDLRAGRIISYNPNASEPLQPPDLDGMVGISADNVIEHYYESVQYDDRFGIVELPSVVPPFPLTWVEGRAPRNYRWEGRAHPWPPGWHQRWGGLFATTDLTQGLKGSEEERIAAAMARAETVASAPGDAR